MYTDSLSATQALINYREHCRNNAVIRNIVDTKTGDNLISINWIPAHVGIPGNEVADKLAKQSLTNPVIDINNPKTLQDRFSDIEKYVLAKWQQSWDSKSTTKHYKKIQKTISTKSKYDNHNRNKEKSISRIRLGKCQLNGYLHTINRHKTGLCDTCAVPETVQHFLMECQNKVTSAVKLHCTKKNIPWNIETILSNSSTLDVIFDNIERKI